MLPRAMSAARGAEKASDLLLHGGGRRQSPACSAGSKPVNGPTTGEFNRSFEAGDERSDSSRTLDRAAELEDDVAPGSHETLFGRVKSATGNSEHLG